MPESSENSAPFKEGALVQLLSGGPVMTVTRCIQGTLNSQDDWSCSLLYADNQGIIQRERSIEARFLAAFVPSLDYQLQFKLGDSIVSSNS